MATNTLTTLTLKELTARIDPNGNAARIAEVLHQKNMILDDIPWMESNETFSNRTVRRAAEPTGTYRKLNAGVAYEASKTIPVVDVIGMLESYSKVDVRLAEAAPNGAAAFRSQEDMAFVGGMGKTFAESLIYGNAAELPEEFTGLAPRMDAATDTNVIDAGGSGSDCTSIFVVTWDVADGVHGIYGRGSQGGLQMHDEGIVVMGEKPVAGTASAQTLINRWYVTHFAWEGGLAVRDPQYMGRVASIESSKTGTSNIFSEDDLIDLLVEMETGPSTRIYMHRNIMAQAWKRLKDKNNVFFGRNEGLDAGGMPLNFNGFPIRQVDQISITETAL